MGIPSRSFSARRHAAVALATSLLMACSGAPPDDDSGTPSATAAEGTPTVTQVPTVAIDLSASTLDFGTADPGQAVVKDLVVENTGNVSVSLTSYDVGGSKGSWFRLTGLGIVSPGATATLTVTFTPQSYGAATSTVTVSATPEEGGFSFTVRGTGACTDRDGDGQCSVDTGGQDCDDTDDDVYYTTSGGEVCDGKDNDCNGVVDDNAEDADAWYRDGDGDGYGATPTRTLSCEQPQGRSWVSEGGDCADDDASVNPGAPEICDGINNNCKGGVDEGFDADGDGSPDCSDDDGDGYCEGQTCIADADGGEVLPGDCDDDNAGANPAPGNLEVPGDHIDNNCNGEVDENVPPQVRFVSPEADGQLLPRGENTTLTLSVTDVEDGSGVGVTIQSDIDGALCVGESDAAHTFSCEASLSFGQHTLTATATDSDSEEGTATRAVTVDTPPEVSSAYPRGGEALSYGETYTFNALASDPDPEQSSDALEFVWSSDLSGELARGVAVNSFASAQVSFDVEGEHVLTFTAYDAFGASSSFSVTVTVGEPSCSMGSALVALYHFNEGVGLSTADASGHGLNGQLQGTADWEPQGKFGYGLKLSGENPYVSVANAGGQLSLSAFTVEGWVRFTTQTPLQTPSRQPIVNKPAVDGGPGENYDLRVNGDGVAQAKVEKTTGPAPNQEIVAPGVTTFVRNEWNLITMTFDGVNLRVFVNGVQDGSATTATVNLHKGDGPLYFGTDAFSGATQPRYMNGVLDEVRILSCALSERQIHDDYEADSAHQAP